MLTDLVYDTLKAMIRPGERIHIVNIVDALYCTGHDVTRQQVGRVLAYFARPSIGVVERVGRGWYRRPATDK